MHHALLFVAVAIARAHDSWRHQIGRRRSLVGRGALFEERVVRLEVENGLL